MEITTSPISLKPLEVRSASVGLILAGLAIVLTGVSYILNMTFTYQWLVFIVGIAFIVVGILTIEMPRGFRNPGEKPEGRFRLIILVSMPLAFIVSSQVCGIGLRACNAACHLLNLALIVLAAFTAIRFYRGQSIGALLIPLIVFGLVPHCVCHAPINTLWHSILGGVAPTCNMIPLATTLFAVLALRGVRTRYCTILIILLYVVMVFIIVGSLLFGFPWQGCVDHPGVVSVMLN